MTIQRDYPADSWTARPGASNRIARIAAQAQADVRSTLRNGEQLLLTLVIPLALLVGLTLFDVAPTATGESTIDVVAPSIIALAVMSTAFTSLAIATGFDRRSGALKLLGTTPLTRVELVSARALGVLVIEAIQVVLIIGVSVALGWTPAGNPLAALLLVVLGTVAFAACGVALAGVLRAEATLAVANGIYLLLLLGGGVVIPQSSFPAPMAAIVSLLPSGALAGGLREALGAAGGWPWLAAVVLIVWAGAGFAVAARTFRWD
ncbi:MAG: ABC transporter permease [Actinobacteria bacterium]|nr:ABC transporter permease [Actinomycetota bacterium]MCB9412387.1 ABC transporter permease [Actinomycetota bacterium]